MTWKGKGLRKTTLIANAFHILSFFGRVNRKGNRWLYIEYAKFMSKHPQREPIPGFSKLNKDQKIDAVSALFSDPAQIRREFTSYWHPEPAIQQRLDEFSENTLTNFYFPFGVVPNVMLNGKRYMVPMVIEESSVVAAASKSAKFWEERGGFHARVKDVLKVGQVHFIWEGPSEVLKQKFPEIRQAFFQETLHITSNMQKRGGGIRDIILIDCTDVEPGYYQFKATFDTCDSMGANFINSCLEEFAGIFKDWCEVQSDFSPASRKPHVIMSILSNYTPDCIVEAWVECPVEALGFHEDLDPETFAWKFSKAVRVAELDTFRATTHNKGIFNGIDAVVLATGNDFRAVEACGHTHAARHGKYQSLTKLELANGHFKYTLEIPMALGVVGGLTSLHPLVRRALEMLGNPSAAELMMVAATMGLANNFGALRSLTTTGIQKGHMKMHLLNILNHFEATEVEKEAAVQYFKNHKVSFNAVRAYLIGIREAIITAPSKK